MQLIKVNTFTRNGASSVNEIAIDVDSLAEPIRFQSNNKSFVRVFTKKPYSLSIPDDYVTYEVYETLQQIKNQSANLLLLTVNNRRGVAIATPEEMVFNAAHVATQYVPVSAGTYFEYNEFKNPTSVAYIVDEDVDAIITQQAAIGGTVTESIIIAVSDETTAITTGTAKVTFRMPYAFTLTKVKGSLTTAPVGGGGTPFTVDVNKNGTTIFSTKLTIDIGETTSETAAIPNVLSTTSFANDDVITIDIDGINGGFGAGLKIYLIGNQ